MGAPAVIVYSSDQITAALSAAQDVGCDILILSPRHAAASLGAGLFRAMIEQAIIEKAGEQTGKTCMAALDCGNDSGHALAAIRDGVEVIVLSEDSPAYNRVADIAQQNNVRLLPPDVYEPDTSGTAPLDLMESTDPLAACREFLHIRNEEHNGLTEHRRNG